MDKVATNKYYKLSQIVQKFKNLPQVEDVVLNSDRNQLIILSGNDNVKQELEIIQCQTLDVDGMPYVCLKGLDSLKSLSKKTKKGNESDDHLLE